MAVGPIVEPDALRSTLGSDMRIPYITPLERKNGVRIIDFIKIRFDFWNAFCVSAKFGSYAARNMFP
jgi:hypothetical protein